MSRGGGRPTMKDVASRAGVALKTVSRVVNREPGVTPETTKRVLGAIEDLGFRRNESARLLRTGHTATLGYIADTWTDPDHAAVYRGLEQVARAHGFPDVIAPYTAAMSFSVPPMWRPGEPTLYDDPAPDAQPGADTPGAASRRPPAMAT